MSGPALRQWQSHSSIHNAALAEAKEITSILEKYLDHNDMDKALEIANIAVEHWETRTLRHAEAEEEGLYKEISSECPEFSELIIELTRDHQLMRNLVLEIKDTLENKGIDRSVLYRFHALILIDLLHNHDEEKIVNVD